MSIVCLNLLPALSLGLCVIGSRRVSNGSQRFHARARKPSPGLLDGNNPALHGSY